MPDLSSPNLLTHHGFVKDIEESMHQYDVVSVSELIRKLQHLGEHYESRGDGGISFICETARDRLVWVSEKRPSLSPADRQMLIGACEELRLRMIASALSSIADDAASQARKAGIVSALISEVAGSVGSLVIHGYGGVIHALVESTRVIIVPRVSNEEGSEVVYEELLDIYDRKSSDESWVIDLSQVTDLTWELLDNLIAFAVKLRKEGEDFHLCWLRPDLVSPKQMKRLRKHFDLQSIGGHYFSKGRS